MPRPRRRRALRSVGSLTLVPGRIRLYPGIPRKSVLPSGEIEDRAPALRGRSSLACSALPSQPRSVGRDCRANEPLGSRWPDGRPRWRLPLTGTFRRRVRLRDRSGLARVRGRRRSEGPSLLARSLHFSSRAAVLTALSPIPPAWGKKGKNRDPTRRVAGSRRLSVGDHAAVARRMASRIPRSRLCRGTRAPSPGAIGDGVGTQLFYLPWRHAAMVVVDDFLLQPLVRDGVLLF